MIGYLKLSLERAFDHLHRELGQPALFAVPWQTPAGLTYDADVDAWVDGSGAVAEPDLYTLTETEVPALWGADAESLALGLAGIGRTGDLVAIARATYQATLAGAMMVRTAAGGGDEYVVSGLENAPDGGAAVFVVAQLQRRKA